MIQKTPHLLVFGPGYSARPIMKHFKDKGWKVSASWRRSETKQELEHLGYRPVALNVDSDPINHDLTDVTHILTSIAPKHEKDPILPTLKEWQPKMPNITWIGYLSSTNVYGNHDGAWVDELTQCTPSLDRGKRRLKAEDDWKDFSNFINARYHIFRLAGIYGPGRNAIRTMMVGKTKRIIKEGQVFSRIHVEDICQVVVKAASGTYGTNIFNLADDYACPPQDVIVEAAKLLGVSAPPAQDWETADLSPMARSFYLESKRVKNDKIKSILDIKLKYPTYKVGLTTLLKYEMNQTNG